MFEKIRQNIQKYVHLTDIEFKHFTDQLIIKTLKKQQTIVREGDVCRIFSNMIDKIDGFYRWFILSEK